MSGYTLTDPNTVNTTLLQDSQPAFSLVPQDVRSAFTSAFGMIPNVQTASYTLVLTDLGKCVVMNSASAVNLTVPPNSSVAFQVGSVISWYNLGAGLTTFVAGVGVTIEAQGSLTVLATKSIGGLWQRAANTWVLWGP